MEQVAKLGKVKLEVLSYLPDYQFISFTIPLRQHCCFLVSSRYNESKIWLGKQFVQYQSTRTAISNGIMYDSSASVNQ